mgnify:FL=1
MITINEMMTTITLMNNNIAPECMRCINDIAFAYLNELCIDEHIHPSVINEIFNTHFPEDNFDYWKDICEEDEDKIVYDFVNLMEKHVNEKSNDKKNLENLKKVMIDLQEVGIAIYRNI